MKIVNISKIVKEKDLFYCDNSALNKKLLDNGYVYVSSHILNDKELCIYIRSAELDKVVNLWI